MGEIIKLNVNKHNVKSFENVFDEFIQEKQSLGRKKETISYYNDIYISFR